MLKVNAPEARAALTITALAAALTALAPTATADPAPIGWLTGSAYPGSGPATSFHLCNLARFFTQGTPCLPPQPFRPLPTEK
ncbi:hypothetical protein ACFVMC_10050 [Nocardia sp. NPDC127579]|uniref:hypothetical protein n=1 Tax=Nocardia sp. NPDC127579 TaxID=3345402 RepID=UPI00363A537C